MDKQVTTQIIDLVPLGIGADGVRVYGSEFDAGAIAACRLLMEHPHETAGVLALTALVVIACCELASPANPPRKRNAKKNTRARR
jgi:hypothetical protein